MPDVDCGDFRRLVHPFIDCELDIETAAAAERHRGSCAACAGLAEHYQVLGRRVRDAMGVVAPASLREQAARILAVTQRRRRRWRIAMSLSAAAVLALALGGWWLGSSPFDDDDVREVIALHQRSQLPGHLLDLETSDLARIAPWFAHALPFSPSVGDLSSLGFQLQGARLDWCDNQRVAVLVYRHDGHLVNLVSYPAEHHDERPPAATTRENITLCGWCHDGLQYFAASDLPPEKLIHLASLATSNRG
jgi:anti-sigma factor RsiW